MVQLIQAWWHLTEKSAVSSGRWFLEIRKLKAVLWENSNLKDGFYAVKPGDSPWARHPGARLGYGDKGRGTPFCSFASRSCSAGSRHCGQVLSSYGQRGSAVSPHGLFSPLHNLLINTRISGGGSCWYRAQGVATEPIKAGAKGC